MLHLFSIYKCRLFYICTNTLMDLQMHTYVGHPWVAYDMLHGGILSLNGVAVFWPPDQNSDVNFNFRVLIQKPSLFLHHI